MIDDRLSDGGFFFFFFFGRENSTTVQRLVNISGGENFMYAHAEHHTLRPCSPGSLSVFHFPPGLTVIKNRWPILSTLSWFTMFLRVLSALRADGAAAQGQNEKAQRAMSPRDVSNYRYERACVHTRGLYVRGCCLNAYYRASDGEKRNGIMGRKRGKGSFERTRH